MARKAHDATISQREQSKTQFRELEKLSNKLDHSLERMSTKFEAGMGKIEKKLDSIPGLVTAAINDHEQRCLAAKRAAHRAMNTGDSDGAIPMPLSPRENSQAVDLSDQMSRGVIEPRGIPRWVWILGTAIGAALSGGMVHWLSSFQS